MRRPSLLHRLTAVLSSTLLLQLSLRGSGTLCSMHGHETTKTATAHSAHMSHGAHRMADGVRAQAPAAVSPVATDGATPTGLPGGCDMSETSCNMPWSPSGCASMSACAIGVSAPAQVALAIGSTAAPSVELPAAGSLPLGPTYAPELPPPRT